VLAAVAEDTMTTLVAKAASAPLSLPPSSSIVCGYAHPPWPRSHRCLRLPLTVAGPES
jgi:hypothetical protein